MQTAVVDQRTYQILLDEHQQLKIAYAGLQQQILQLQKMIFGSRTSALFLQMQIPPSFHWV